MTKDDDQVKEGSSLINQRLVEKAGSRYKKDMDIPPGLIEGIMEGREEAYNQLYLHFVDPLMDFVMCYRISREDAEEIVQETFTYIWTKRETLNPARNIKGLLYTCAKNYCLDFLRKKKVIKKYMALPDSERDDELPADEDYIARELRILIDAVIEQMPPVRKKVFLMNQYDGMTASEIAKVLNTREQVVRRHIVSAKADIKKILAVVSFFLIP